MIVGLFGTLNGRAALLPRLVGLPVGVSGEVHGVVRLVAPNHSYLGRGRPQVVGYYGRDVVRRHGGALDRRDERFAPAQISADRAIEVEPVCWV